MARKSKSIIQVTKHLNKKGRLKGKNKKETKALKGMCPHHKITKRGKVKPTIFNQDGKYCICYMCGQEFPMNFYKNEELDEIIGNMKELNNHNKYTSVATNSGDGMVDFFANVGVALEQYKKNAKRVRNVASKEHNVKRRRNNKATGSSQFGSWGRR